VSFNVRTGKWVARLFAEGVRRHLGYFETAGEAGEAYLEAKAQAAGERAGERVRAAPSGRRPSGGRQGGSHVGHGAGCVCQQYLGEGFREDVLAHDQEGRDLGMVMRVSRVENVSPWTVSEAWWLMAFEEMEDFEAGLRAVVGDLRRAGLLDRAGEVVARACSTGHLVERDVAIADVLAGWAQGDPWERWEPFV
jgi:hypothetical protein